MVKKIHTTRECKVVKEKYRDNPRYYTKDYKIKYREVNLLEKEAAHQRDKDLKYKKLKKAFVKNTTHAILDDPLDSDSYSSSKSHNSRDKYKKASIAYESD